MRKFIIRTVRNGKIKFGSTSFTPSNKYMEYDGRLEGQKLAFSLYASHDKDKDEAIEYRSEDYMPFILLCGSEKEYTERNEDVNALYVVDNELPWEWWYPKEEEIAV